MGRVPGQEYDLNHLEVRTAVDRLLRDERVWVQRTFLRSPLDIIRDSVCN